jgi:hypothetical protein
MAGAAYLAMKEGKHEFSNNYSFKEVARSSACDFDGGIITCCLSTSFNRRG